MLEHWEHRRESALRTPAMMSDAPDMNLVRECTTTSAPHFAGLMTIGLKVLSTTKDMP